MKRTLVTAIAMALEIASILHAGDTQTPDQEMAARISAAEAKLKAKNAATTQPATTNDPTLLRAIIQDQKQQIEALNERIRACYALSPQFISRASMRNANAAKCMPASVVASRS